MAGDREPRRRFRYAVAVLPVLFGVIAWTLMTPAPESVRLIVFVPTVLFVAWLLFRAANFQDITRRKNAELALELERSRMKQLLEGAPFAVVAYEGPDHRAVLSNPKHEENAQRNDRHAIGAAHIGPDAERNGREDDGRGQDH